MKIVYKPTVIKQLKKLPQQKRSHILKKLYHLTTEPYAGKPLRGQLEGLRSLKICPYRVIYEIKGKTIRILSIAHRQSAYS